MGRLTVNGLDGIIDDFSELAKLPDSVITDILNAEADVIVQAQTSGTSPYTRRGAANAAGVPHATRKSRLSMSTGRTGGISPPARPSARRTPKRKTKR